MILGFCGTSPTFGTAASPPWPVRYSVLLFILFSHCRLLFFALLHLSSIVRQPANILIADLWSVDDPPELESHQQHRLSGSDLLTFTFSRLQLFALRFKSVTIVIGGCVRSRSHSLFFRLVADDVFSLVVYNYAVVRRRGLWLLVQFFVIELRGHDCSREYLTIRYNLKCHKSKNNTPTAYRDGHQRAAKLTRNHILPRFVFFSLLDLICFSRCKFLLMTA